VCALVKIISVKYFELEKMGIATRTRKLLWAKSGNRCAICRLELVQNEEEQRSVVVGQECHIVSSKPKGPRGDQGLHCADFDDFENLLLLCANDHIEIDTLTEKYSVKKLRTLKESHEEWVRLTLSADPLAFTNDKFKVSSLKKIDSGSELIKLVDGADVFMFDNDDLITEKETDLIPTLFDNLREYTDILDLMEFKDKTKLGLDLNNTIQKIEKMGFQIFGHKRNLKRRNDEEDMGRWNMATIIIARNENPGITDGFLIARTPNQYRF